jgi:hypothetical protein
MLSNTVSWKWHSRFTHLAGSWTNLLQSLSTDGKCLFPLHLCHLVTNMLFKERLYTEPVVIPRRNVCDGLLGVLDFEATWMGQQRYRARTASTRRTCYWSTSACPTTGIQLAFRQSRLSIIAFHDGRLYATHHASCLVFWRFPAVHGMAS